MNMGLLQKLLLAWVASVSVLLALGFFATLVFVAIRGPVKPSNVIDHSKAVEQFNSTLASEGLAVFVDSMQVDRGILVVSVHNHWHMQAKQNRLQHAQNMWAIWAEICSPNDPDKARIWITDKNGNRVGGSGIAGGSMVWVID